MTRNPHRHSAATHPAMTREHSHLAVFKTLRCVNADLRNKQWSDTRKNICKRLTNFSFSGHFSFTYVIHWIQTRATNGERQKQHTASGAAQQSAETQTALNHISGRDLPQIRGSLESQLESNNIMRLMGNFLLSSQAAHFPPVIVSSRPQLWFTYEINLTYRGDGERHFLQMSMDKRWGWIRKYHSYSFTSPRLTSS